MPPTPLDFPNLIPLLGFHTFTLENIEQVCVDPFPLSTSRLTIMQGLRTFVQRLHEDGVEGQLWIDGSFLTEKIDPKDVDVLLLYDGVAYNAGSKVARDRVDWVIANQKHTLSCDSYVLMEYPKGHSLHTEGEWWYAYWHRQWGFSRDDDPKAIVVLELGGGP